MEMAKYIDSDEAQKVLNDVLTDVDDIEEEEPEVYVDGFVCGVGVALEKLKTIIPADVAPVRHGHWIAKEFGDEYFTYTNYFCSECGRKLVGYVHLSDAPYCHCGAKMDGKDGEENGQKS